MSAQLITNDRLHSFLVFIFEGHWRIALVPLDWFQERKKAHTYSGVHWLCTLSAGDWDFIVKSTNCIHFLWQIPTIRMGRLQAWWVSWVPSPIFFFFQGSHPSHITKWQSGWCASLRLVAGTLNFFCSRSKQFNFNNISHWVIYCVQVVGGQTCLGKIKC